jgi:hypothetical protein
MNIQELANKAAEVINHAGKSGFPGQDTLQLVMPHRKKWAETRYLAGRNSPKGTYLDYCKDGEIINFDAIDMLAWCVANGATGTAVIDGKQVNLADLLPTTAPDSN